MSEKIAGIRQELKNKIIDAKKHYRILYLGRSVNGSTDIVSCMYRGLKNLGHKVLNLDVAKHQVLENPLKMQGGNGPIYVNFDKIETVIQRFRPQFIIFGAGGLTFYEEDFNFFKN